MAWGTQKAEGGGGGGRKSKNTCQTFQNLTKSQAKIQLSNK